MVRQVDGSAGLRFAIRPRLSESNSRGIAVKDGVILPHERHPKNPQRTHVGLYVHLHKDVNADALQIPFVARDLVSIRLDHVRRRRDRYRSTAQRELNWWQVCCVRAILMHLTHFISQSLDAAGRAHNAGRPCVNNPTAASGACQRLSLHRNLSHLGCPMLLARNGNRWKVLVAVLPGRKHQIRPNPQVARTLVPLLQAEGELLHVLRVHPAFAPFAPQLGHAHDRGPSALGERVHLMVDDFAEQLVLREELADPRGFVAQLRYDLPRAKRVRHLRPVGLVSLGLA
mmetsp:Transcript_27043/g.70012  ORF Transcript_27043/g.70012 Transcript_27043/m.70012 type:complete len:286 (-) Transcript_27043:310-1167(-)